MFFRRSQAESRAQGWQAFVAKLELSAIDGAERRLRDLLDLARASFEAVYGLALDDERRLYLFDYREATGRMAQLVTVCLLSLKEPRWQVSLRASKRSSPLLASLGASAVGGEQVIFPQDPAFSQAVTVVARDTAGARSLLTPAARKALQRALAERSASPTLRLGERHLVLSHRARAENPLAFEALELMLSDLLSLYAALTASEQRG
jgi:hypothetical protein